MVYREHYFLAHPDCLRINGGDGEYPAQSDGKCLCAKDAGYVDRCRAGEGLFDCRDCWNGRFEGVLQNELRASEHKDDTVHLGGEPQQKRTVNINIKLPMNFPAHWSDDDIDFFLNESSWCWSNIIRELQRYEDEKRGCICSICEGSVIPGNLDDKFFCIWCDADIVGLLERIGVEPTAERVKKVRCACINNHHFTDNMIEAGWETLEQYAKDALGLFVRE